MSQSVDYRLSDTPTTVAEWTSTDTRSGRYVDWYPRRCGTITHCRRVANKVGYSASHAYPNIPQTLSLSLLATRHECAVKACWRHSGNEKEQLFVMVAIATEHRPSATRSILYSLMHRDHWVQHAAVAWENVSMPDRAIHPRCEGVSLFNDHLVILDFHFLLFRPYLGDLPFCAISTTYICQQLITVILRFWSMESENEQQQFIRIFEETRNAWERYLQLWRSPNWTSLLQILSWDTLRWKQ